METPKVFSVLFHIFCCFLICFSYAPEYLGPGETLHSNETLVSANGVFELGFFSYSESSNTYLGIWFKNDKNKKPVWVANRENPLVDSSGYLEVRSDGNLVLSDRRDSLQILNIDALLIGNKTSLEVLDSGNLVLVEGEKIIWQSFDYPSDTFLPGMKLGLFNIGTDQLKYHSLNSWLGPFLPDLGQYILGIDGENLTRFNVLRGGRAYQEIGFWDGNTFRFFFESSSKNYNFSYSSNSVETYITFSNKESNVFSWFVIAHNGMINEFRMVGQEISVMNHSLCDDTLTRSSSECLVMVPTLCEEGNNFSDFRGIIPISMFVSTPAPKDLSECELICRRNCSCAAYASLDDHRCELYYGNKDHLLKSIERGNITVYLRGEASKSDDQKKKKLLLIIPAVVIPFSLMILISLFCLWRKCSCSGISGRKCGIRDILLLLSSRLSTNRDDHGVDAIVLGGKKDQELPMLRFSFIVAATDNFSPANKLGEGGFGPVYKGKLQGLDIAVKRLSQSSGQGLAEFKNEVELISKLQHRNLVKLLGYCMKQEEKILIYEYMANKSLDSFIFDPIRRPLLDWRKRIEIIDGIAQGLLYLHKYSRLRIIHRDLKTSNILLDENMNPKISDFGMARIFLENESQAKTKRLAGTYGYMSPEYAAHGLFSTKSDVFSFGVILLEIVSGRKNNVDFYEPNSSLSLLGYAWDLWNAGKCMELMDPSLNMAAANNSCPIENVMMCIQVGLLCVQESSEERPTMFDVVLMLSNDGVSLPAPKRPAFSTLLSVSDDSPSKRERPSQNLATMSAVEAR